jgi:hypothetical protein
MSDTLDVPPGVDPDRPSPARLYDYYLGGTHNLPVDREAAEKLKAAAPDLLDAVWANRGFHGRAAIWMAEQGIRQFIDIGSGLPTPVIRRTEGDSMTESEQVPPGVDPTWPSPARLYDYFLGGTNHFPADREAAEKLKALVPDIVDAMWANRGFHGRAAVWLAEHGIRQFIDIGSGLPTQNNTHEAVQKADPGARVVYVDDDPMVVAHGGPLRAGDGTTTLIAADWRDPAAVLGHPGLRKLIDFAEPAGVLMTAVLQFVADGSNPWGLVARYMGAVVPGSYLALSHPTKDNLPPRSVQAALDTYANATAQVHPRSKAEVERFFYGLELIEPYPGAGPVVTYGGLWGAEDPVAADSDGSRAFYCGVARRPGTTVRRESAPGGLR